MRFEFLNSDTFIAYLPQIMQLYKECFNRGLTEQSFVWRYLQNPIDDILFVVAKENNKIIASYAASPCLIIMDNNEYKTALSLNTMTHPVYQGKGLFVSLAEKLYGYMKSNGYVMIWGFPNNISNRVFNDKLGWITIHEVPTMTFNVDKQIKRESKCSLIIDKYFSLDYYDLEKYNIKDIFVKKYPSYLRWRYTTNPDNYYINMAIVRDKKVASYIVFKEYKELLNIIDLNFREFYDAQEMIEQVINHAYIRGKKKVTIWAPINTKLHSYLEKVGFYNDFPIRYLGGKILVNDPIYDKLLSYYKWFLNLGDNNEY